MSENELMNVYTNKVTLKEYLMSKDWILVGSKMQDDIIAIKEKKPK